MPDCTTPYNGILPLMQRLIMQPIHIGNLTFVLIDALSANHEINWAYPPHRHPWYEFNFVAEGGLYTTSADCEFRIEAGHSYLIPPGIIHSHRHREGERDDGFCLRWQLHPADRNNNSGSDSNMLTVEERELLRCFTFLRPYALGRDVLTPLLSLRPGISQLSLRQTFACWLLSLYEAWRIQPETVDKATGWGGGTPGETVVRQTLLYLKEYYANEVRVEDIANALHVSYRNLARLFQKQMGLTVMEKLSEIRIQQAKKLLIETDLPMKQIARAVGLKNEYYFSNVFKRYALVTPTEFRAHRWKQVNVGTIL